MLPVSNNHVGENLLGRTKANILVACHGFRAGPLRTFRSYLSGQDSGRWPKRTEGRTLGQTLES